MFIDRPNLLNVTLTAALGLAGCGAEDPDVFPVQGRITYQGRPVVTGQIVFHPAHGRPALGAIEPDGRYQLTTFTPHDGAVPGKHRITIQAVETTGGEGPRSFDEELQRGSGTPGVTRWLVPAQYADAATSPLEREVQAARNEFDFHLP